MRYVKSVLAALFLSQSLSCHTSTSSGPLVTGGREDYDILPTSVGLATVIDVIEIAPSCTGGFITDRLLITAAHCIITYRKEAAEKGVRIVSNAPAFKDKKLVSQTFLSHPSYEAEKNKLPVNADLGPLAWADIGFIVFPAGTAPPEMVMKFATELPQPGDLVQLVGWGFRMLEPTYMLTEKRHYGLNVIKSINPALNDLIIVEGMHTEGSTNDPLRASAGIGDSGGPLYNAKNELIGITSYIYQTDHIRNITLSGYANVLNAETKKFISRTIEENR